MAADKKYSVLIVDKFKIRKNLVLFPGIERRPDKQVCFDKKIRKAAQPFLLAFGLRPLAGNRSKRFSRFVSFGSRQKIFVFFCWEAKIDFFIESSRKKINVSEFWWNLGQSKINPDGEFQLNQILLPFLARTVMVAAQVVEQWHLI